MKPINQIPLPGTLPTLITFAITTKGSGDEDKIFISLTKMLEEDSALKLERTARDQGNSIVRKRSGPY